jgi:hypothetical protein
MCGKDSTFDTFNPKILDHDIYVRYAGGLGYGGGFYHGPDESVLGDEIFTPKILDRCIDLLNLFQENKICTKRELATKLKIGVHIQGIDEVVQYDDFIKMKNLQIEHLQKKVTSSNSESLGYEIKLRELEEIKKSYNLLLKNLDLKKKINEILKYLHENLESKIILKEDDWILVIYKYDPVINIYLSEKLHTLNKEERSLLKKRIQTNSEEFEAIFQIFKDIPKRKPLAYQMLEWETPSD